MAQIRLEHISKRFEIEGKTVDALQDINLEIEKGDIYGIIGMSGAGKSTLVRCLNFFLKINGNRTSQSRVSIHQKNRVY